MDDYAARDVAPFDGDLRAPCAARREVAVEDDVLVFGRLARVEIVDRIDVDGAAVVGEARGRDVPVAGGGRGVRAHRDRAARVEHVVRHRERAAVLVGAEARRIELVRDVVEEGEGALPVLRVRRAEAVALEHRAELAAHALLTTLQLVLELFVRRFGDDEAPVGGVERFGAGAPRRDVSFDLRRREMNDVEDGAEHPPGAEVHAVEERPRDAVVLGVPADASGRVFDGVSRPIDARVRGARAGRAGRRELHALRGGDRRARSRRDVRGACVVGRARHERERETRGEEEQMASEVHGVRG